MRAERIDPRDQTSQVDDPRYRVYFWAAGGGAKEEWQLSDADLDEVLEWIPSQSQGRTHSLWAVTRTATGVCLIRLRGIDTEPNQRPIWAKQVSR